MRLVCALSFFILATGVAHSASTPSYKAPGDLLANSGNGYRGTTVFKPGMRFPLESADAYANSQVYRPGGNMGGPGGQCDASNYTYPWQDNFCEARGKRVNAICPTGFGHQGQDIRPSTCKANLHFAVAAEDGVIAAIGTYTVTLQGKSGTIYRYLHMQMNNLNIKLLDEVKQGGQLGRVSNNFGGTSTTIHLHFEIKDRVVIGEKSIVTFVPPYSSLIAAQKALLSSKP